VLQFLVRLCLSVARFIYKNKQERKKQNKTKKMILCMALGNWQKFVETETESEEWKESNLYTYVHTLKHSREIGSCKLYLFLSFDFDFFLN